MTDRAKKQSENKKSRCNPHIIGTEEGAQDTCAKPLPGQSRRHTEAVGCCSVAAIQFITTTGTANTTTLSIHHEALQGFIPSGSCPHRRET